MIVSDYIINELIDFAKHAMSKTPRGAIRLMHQALEQYARPHQERKVAIRDMNDVAVMQLAIEHEAMIVTSDKDLLEHRNGAIPPVLSVSEYEELFMN